MKSLRCYHFLTCFSNVLEVCYRFVAVCNKLIISAEYVKMKHRQLEVELRQRIVLLVHRIM